jgi:hypothetical protein
MFLPPTGHAIYLEKQPMAKGIFKIIPACSEEELDKYILPPKGRFNER